MSDNSRLDNKPPPQGVQPKPGTVSDISRTNDEQRREAARKLAERHNAALRASRDGTAARS